MNNKIILIIFLSIWTLFYIISLLIINTNYTRVNKVLLKPINKISDNIHIEKKNYYDDIYKKNSLIKFEAKLDFNKTCQIDILNYKMIENIVYNIENNNYKYFTIVNSNNICEKPETFNIVILEKISLHLFLIFISVFFTLVFIIFIFKKNKYIDINSNVKNDNNDKKNDNNDNDIDNYNQKLHINIDIANLVHGSKLNNYNSGSESSSNELDDYDIIQTNEIKKIDWLEYV